MVKSLTGKYFVVVGDITGRVIGTMASQSVVCKPTDDHEEVLDETIDGLESMISSDVDRHFVWGTYAEEFISSDGKLIKQTIESAEVDFRNYMKYRVANG